MSTATSRPSAGTAAVAVEARLELHRTELTGYCYRMLGSAADAEDAVQETFTRAWRGIDRFEERAALRTWLYRIASNVCFDSLAATKRRAMPVDLGPDGNIDEPLAPPLPGSAWVGPAPDSLVIGDGGGDPALLSEARESVRLALVAALQHLPPRQRAILILRDVLGWSAKEVGELLHLSVAAVNSALQRARATLESRDLESSMLSPADAAQADAELLRRYVDAFERYDMTALTALLHEDATQSMPPYPLWLRGRERIVDWMVGPGIGCEGSVLVPVRVNGQAGYAQYRDGGATPWSVHLPVFDGGRIVTLTYFLETDGSLFATFGLPPRLPGVAAGAPQPGAAGLHRI